METCNETGRDARDARDADATSIDTHLAINRQLGSASSNPAEELPEGNMASLYKKTVTRIDAKTGKSSKAKSAKWWIKYRDADDIVRRVPGYTDKAATQQEAARLERQAELGRAGVRDPYAKHRGRPLAEHLADFERHLSDKGDTEDQVKLVTSRVRKVVEGCKFKVIEDISPSKVEAFLAELRKDGASIQTSNHYLRSIKQFTR